MNVGTSGYYDDLETRDPQQRETALFAALPTALRAAVAAPGWRAQLRNIDLATVTNRAMLATLPVQRKADLPALQKADLPFGGLVPGAPATFARLFASPGPIYEAEGGGDDPWHTARAMFAAGFRPGDILLNTFSYHLTPGGFIMDSGARALGCAVIPAGPGNTELQLDAITAFHPCAYAGTPDYLNILLEVAAKQERDIACIRKAMVSGAAFPRSLQLAFAARGIEAYQTYAIAEFGVVAYETPAREGLVVNEDLILEIVRPGTGDPVAEGEVGEVLITALDPLHPLIRFALGDLSAVLAGASPCGRTNMRIKGWMGRADQTAKVKGMFVRPEQIAAIGQNHPELGRLRLVVSRENETDVMTLKAECAAASAALAASVTASLQSATKLKGTVSLVAPGMLPNDGKVIADERPA